MEYPSQDEKLSMAKNRARHASPAMSSHRTALWRVVYWGGRALQIVGLVLMWWVLLLFANVAGMGVLLQWVMVAAVVFYMGWTCVAWARKSL